MKRGQSPREHAPAKRIKSDLIHLLSRTRHMPTEDRKRELKIVAEVISQQLPMPDMNYLLQQIKKRVEKRSADKKASQKNKEGGAAAVPPGEKEKPEESPSNDDPAQGQKPNLSGSFYPLANIPEDAEKEQKKKEEEKAFKRAKAEKRTAEEEQQYQDLLHGIGDNPVVVDGVLDEQRYDEVLNEAVLINKKLKDWFQVWSHCQIRTNITTQATVILTNKLCLSKDEREIADILGHLMKEKEIGPKNMDEAISKFDTGTLDKSALIGYLLTFIYPSSKGDFGWSRVGWGFAQWWAQCKKYVKTVPQPVEALRVAVKLLQEYRATFEGDKQEKLLIHVTTLLGSRQQAIDALALSGITGDDSCEPSHSPVTENEEP